MLHIMSLKGSLLLVSTGCDEFYQRAISVKLSCYLQEQKQRKKCLKDFSLLSVIF